MAKWRVRAGGREHVFDSPKEAAEFALKALEGGEREVRVERILSWRERVMWRVKRVLCKPLRVRVLYYRIRYRKRQPPLTLPL